MRHLVCVALLLAGSLSLAAGSIDIIPAPKEAVLRKGVCILSSEKEIASIPARIRRRIAPEGYEIDIRPGKVRIAAGGRAGIFYARQTLRQMAASYGGRVPCCRIKDAPRFSWRGFMLDEARHFFGVEYVRKTLEQMAWFKLNKFHWHLTDTQGWRIEIEAYPRLTEKGAVGDNSDRNAPPRYYTKSQIREIVAYAASLNIEVIPEIDMPGHATAANRAYPEHSGGRAGKFPDFTFNVGSEATYKYLETILREVAELFPSGYIHLGADEVFFGNACWMDNPDIRNLIEKEGLDGLKGAEGYFVRRMAAFVTGLGKRPVFWDDALDAGAGQESTLMWWRYDNKDHLHRALADGRKAVLCPALPCYFSYVQDESHCQGIKRHGQWNSLEAVYAFPDLDDRQGDRHTEEAWNLSGKEKANILGIQANLWTERVQNTARADFMIWPRLCALAESAWSAPEVKDYGDFTARMESALRYLDGRGVRYFDFRTPGRTPEPLQPARYNK